MTEEFKRIQIDTNKNRTITEAKMGSITRLTRSGKGSISNARTNYTTKTEKLIKEAYVAARTAAKY